MRFYMPPLRDLLFAMFCLTAIFVDTLLNLAKLIPLTKRFESLKNLLTYLNHEVYKFAKGMPQNVQNGKIRGNTKVMTMPMMTCNGKPTLM